MDEILMETEMDMESAIEVLDKRLTNIRAGRANPSILDGVMVNYYGADTPLKQLATISIPEARQLCIKPFDKGSIGAIEKAIFEANVGLTPNNNGETVILNIPSGTQNLDKHRIKDKGVPYVNSSKVGDLYIIIKVVIPTKLDKKQKELFEELANTDLNSNSDFINRFNKFFKK